MSDYRRNLAWKAGQKARAAGKSRKANNRTPGTIFYDDWWDGWNEEDNRIFDATGKTFSDPQPNAPTPIKKATPDA